MASNPRLCTDPGGMDMEFLSTTYNLKMKMKYFKNTQKWDSSQLVPNVSAADIVI